MKKKFRKKEIIPKPYESMMFISKCFPSKFADKIRKRYWKRSSQINKFQLISPKDLNRDSGLLMCIFGDKKWIIKCKFRKSQLDLTWTIKYWTFFPTKCHAVYTTFSSHLTLFILLFRKKINIHFYNVFTQKLVHNKVCNFHSTSKTQTLAMMCIA